MPTFYETKAHNWGPVPGKKSMSIQSFGEYTKEFPKGILMHKVFHFCNDCDFVYSYVLGRETKNLPFGPCLEDSN